MSYLKRRIDIKDSIARGGKHLESAYYIAKQASEDLDVAIEHIRKGRRLSGTDKLLQVKAEIESAIRELEKSKDG